MDRLATDFLAIQMLTIGTMLGCGVMPPGLARTVGFNVTGFTLPVSMVYTGNPTLPARFPSIHTTSGAVQAFLTRIVMQTVYDVLQQQGRVVLLPDAMISSILDQLNVRISYNPLECKAIEANPMGPFRHAMHPHCIVFRNAVTGLCLMGGEEELCVIEPDYEYWCHCRHSQVNLRNSHDYKCHHGVLVKRDVAECSGQSNGNISIGPVRTVLLHGICDRHLERKFGSECSK
ncbi:hypothetical protein KIN20_008103 [Parelaphostrongylus tenuis]|uniref:Uncharacterized protein n=1 Tax=Parelaphostrongylus tenuis TaxID=148309 RepID=A0AAD5QJL2_PARTN|nr:hypothetical protein KIN20_008103 [Parelaphostrongylus tenuis]